ncbi:ThuA domain-containing protein [Pelagovum pacificum]|uniref:Trehalose utilization protein ThuA n=1 Tax=Pelagovum pacificum TaxID=2588711 RepID=A0A5C5GL58_9RHOB|nr:ThuA domain-containing protein [Pelagovum pacificum]QQA42733.1 ThuA domain-containing protein [Pelagovum pacificum]TNY34116.1 trehalose utilization protein ThuA [Pelagovum pacificum]
MAINAVVWGENVHEQTNKTVSDLYPEGLHGAIAKGLNADAGISATTATLQEPDHGLTEERLAQTDVLLWWGHAAHGDVEDEVVERVVRHVWAGMGLLVLHSGHFAKVFKRLMGTPCNLYWREAGERERIWSVNRNHPIAKGLPEHFELENEEMYGEPFGIPEPDETVFISWFQGGEVFRSGATWKRGAGKVFYFRPGHETYPTYHDDNVLKVLTNAVHWACTGRAQDVQDVDAAPNVPVSEALEPIEQRGATLHEEGEEGFR